MNITAMKKVLLSIILSGLFITASLATNIALSNFETPDGDKKVKKETLKAEKKTVKAKDTSKDQESITPDDIMEESKSEEYSDPNDLLNNFDCTKEGFDKE